MTRKPTGKPNRPQLMLLRLNQPTLLAIGCASVVKPCIASGRAIAAAMSTTGAPVTGLSSDVIPAYFTPKPGK